MRVDSGIVGLQRCAQGTRAVRTIFAHLFFALAVLFPTITLSPTTLHAQTCGDGIIQMSWVARGSSANWTAITSSSDGTKLAAVVEFDKIYTSTDSGETWTARDSNRYWFSITSSSDGTKLAAVERNGQIYTSTDSGGTWTARESNRDWYSITSSSDGTKLAAVANAGQIFTSTDSGVTWTARESNRSWRSITSSSDGTKLGAVVYGGQIYTGRLEGCDDGNVVDGDTCTSICTVPACNTVGHTVTVRRIMASDART